MTCDHFNTDLEIETENSSKLLKKRSSLIVLAFADPTIAMQGCRVSCIT